MDTARLRVFVEVMRRRSFSAAARDLDLTPSTVSRGIALLEEELGVRLFQRTTRRLSATEAGNLFFERLAPLVDELEKAQSLVSDSEAQPSGTLRVTAPVTFVQLNVLPLLPGFAARYPKLSIDLHLSDAFVDLISERFDVAIRLGRLADSSLITHRLCEMRYVVCASPEYFRRHGTPKAPQDLVHHECLRYPVPGYRAIWRFRDRKRRIQEIAVRGRFAISNGVALRQCAVEGLGVTLLPRWNVARELETGELVEALSNYDATVSEFDASAWVLYPSREYVPLKVRVFVDLLRKAFARGAPNERAHRSAR